MINNHLNSIEDIQQAILSLPESERESILKWLVQMDQELWDREIEADFSKDGPGANLVEQIKNDFKSGLCAPWD